MALWTNQASIRPFDAACTIGITWTNLGCFTQPIYHTTSQPMVFTDPIQITPAINFAPKSASTVFGWR